MARFFVPGADGPAAAEAAWNALRRVSGATERRIGRIVYRRGEEVFDAVVGRSEQRTDAAGRRTAFGEHVSMILDAGDRYLVLKPGRGIAYGEGPVEVDADDVVALEEFDAA